MVVGWFFVWLWFGAKLGVHGYPPSVDKTEMLLQHVLRTLHQLVFALAHIGVEHCYERDGLRGHAFAAHYPACAPVKQLAAFDAVLLLWVGIGNPTTIHEWCHCVLV
jgi:hypothetical protein